MRSVATFEEKVWHLFTLPFEIPKSNQRMNVKDPILLIGSCFADEIGGKMAQNKLEVLSNPFGTIYNPHSIFKLLANKLNKGDTILSQDVYYHWDAHGQIAGITEEELSKLLNRKRTETQDFLKKTKWLIITLGTSIVYEISDNRIVANCHKVPSSRFTKRFLNQNEILADFGGLYQHISKDNPDLNILFTVSPVRHVRDGLVENNRSKAILIDAIHQLQDQYPNVNYFPSYEIIVDELRDYRFYKRDRIHPSDEAVDYIWNRFIETYFDDSSIDFFKTWKKLKNAIDHRPLHPSSPSHQKFLKQTLQKLEGLNDSVDLSVEIEAIKSKIL